MLQIYVLVLASRTIL